jgi:hypothetical protein
VLVGDIVKPQNFTVFNRLLDNRIWAREASEFSYIDLDCLYALVRRFASIKTAQRACDLVVLKLKAAVVADTIDYIRIEQKNYIRQHLTQQRFTELLSTLPTVRQDCIMFALEMNWQLDHAIACERGDMKAYRYEMNARAVEIFQRQPIALGKRNLFWEVVKGEQRMLISLRHQVAQLFQTDWAVLLTQYNRETGKFVDAMTKEEAMTVILQR